MKLNKENVMKVVFFLAALTSVLAVALICVFLFANGIPAIKEIGFADFIFGKTWRPGNDIYGIFPMIMGSIYVTAGAIIIGVPIGVLSAIYLARFCPKKLYKIIKPGIELLAGIPSIVYGFFGLVVLVPMMQKLFNIPVGETAFTGSVVLAIMALPTIITIAEDSMRNTPRAMREASLALGATQWQTIYRVIIPYAKSGISAAVVLGIGRAIGETIQILTLEEKFN